MKTHPSLRLIFALLALGSATSCLQDPPYHLAVTTEPSATSYASTPFATQPAFTISPFSGSVANQGENFTVMPMSDSSCSIGADGAFSSTANQNTVSVRNGVANFMSVGYAPPAHTEETIYLKATGVTTGLTACTTGISVTQHFYTGVGWVNTYTNSLATSAGAATAPGTGAAGGTGAQEVDFANASIIDSQGRILVVGNSMNATSGVQLALWRYFLDGALDTSFGASGTGIIVSDPTASGGAAGATGAQEFDSAQAVKIDSAGNVVIAGTSKNAAGGTELAVWRYTSAGILDPSFGTGGIFISGATSAGGAVGAAQAESVASLQIDSQKHILIAGTSKNAAGGVELAIWRLNDNGTLDSSFNSTGVVVSGTTGAAGATAGNELESVSAFQLDPTTGNLVIAGSSKNLAGGIEMAVRRYLPAGTLDPSFAGTGIYLSGATGVAGAVSAAELDVANSIQVDSQGKIALAGSSKNGANGTELALWRLAANGTLDLSFNTTGYAVFGTTGAAGGIAGAENDAGNSLQIDTNGNWVIAGLSQNSQGGTQAAIWRYLSNGTIDSTFKTAGVALTSSGASSTGVTGPAAYDAAKTLTIDSKGRFVFSGVSKTNASGQEMTVWRFLPTGNLDN